MRCWYVEEGRRGDSTDSEDVVDPASLIGVGFVGSCRFYQTYERDVFGEKGKGGIRTRQDS